jgi:hypothetical protein
MSDGEEVEIEEEVKVRKLKKKKSEVKKASKDSDDEEKSGDEDGEKAKNNEEETNKVKEHLDGMETEEMKLINKLYAESFIRRLLRLIEMFTSVALTSSQPLALVSKVASPYMLFTMLNIILIASPRTKMLALKIITNIIRIGIPAQIFEQTIKLLEQTPNSLGNKILTTVESKITFQSSNFLSFLFKYMLSIRSAMFNKLEV